MVIFHLIVCGPFHGFFWLHVTRMHQKHFLATKGIKIQEILSMKKPDVNYKEETKIWMKKPKLDENRIKIGENFILHP
jgi:hypothetical protein